MYEVLCNRLNAAIATEETNPRAVSLKAGLSAYAVQNIVSGKSSNPGIFTVSRIGQALGRRVGWLIGEEDDSDLPTLHDILGDSIKVIGRAHAGNWLEPFVIAAQATETLPLRSDPRFPDARQYALLMEGASMDRVIQPGSYPVFVDLFESGLQVAEGMLVHVEGKRDDGKLVETSVKRVAKKGKSLVLVAETTEQKIEEMALDGDDRTEIVIHGIMISQYQKLPL